MADTSSAYDVIVNNYGAGVVTIYGVIIVFGYGVMTYDGLVGNNDARVDDFGENVAHKGRCL